MKYKQITTYIHYTALSVTNKSLIIILYEITCTLPLKEIVLVCTVVVHMLKLCWFFQFPEVHKTTNVELDLLL